MSQPTNPYQAPSLRAEPKAKPAKPKLPPIPAWAWIFAALCGAIPLATFGGAIPAAIGFGGAGGCIGLARNTDLNIGVRVLGCIAITVACWGSIGALYLAIASRG